MKGGRRRWNCYLFVVLCIWNGTLSTLRSFDFQLERQRPPLIICFDFFFFQIHSRKMFPWIFAFSISTLMTGRRGWRTNESKGIFIFDFSHEQRMEFIFNSRMKLVSNHPNSDWPFRRQNSSTLWKQKNYNLQWLLLYTTEWTKPKIIYQSFIDIFNSLMPQRSKDIYLIENSRWNQKNWIELNPKNGTEYHVWLGFNVTNGEAIWFHVRKSKSY